VIQKTAQDFFLCKELSTFVSVTFPTRFYRICLRDFLLCSGIAVSMVMKYADNIVKVRHGNITLNLWDINCSAFTWIYIMCWNHIIGHIMETFLLSIAGGCLAQKGKKASAILHGWWNLWICYPYQNLPMFFSVTKKVLMHRVTEIVLKKAWCRIRESYMDEH